MEIKLSRNERGYHVTARLRGKEGYDLLRVDREQLEKLRALIDLELGVDAKTEHDFCERVADALWSKIPGLPCHREQLGAYVHQAITAARWATPPKRISDQLDFIGDIDHIKKRETEMVARLAPLVDEIFDNWPMPGSRTDPATFRPGIYKHYRGGRYVALMLVEMHDTREKYVVYVSCQHETVNVRPWAKPGEDSWTDLVKVAEAVTTETLRGYEREHLVPRFKFVGDK